MAYFPNGTAGMMYEERYCSKCIHFNGPDGKSGCDVWLAHLLYNYEECNNPKSILHLLIPKSEDGLGAEQCRMFVPKQMLASDEVLQALKGDTQPQERD